MAFNPELGSTSPTVLLDNAERLDKLVNGPAADVPDRGGDPLYSWRQMMAKNDEIRQNLIPLSRQYMTLDAAQADIANIPAGSTTYYRSPDDSALAIEVMNVGGTLQPTGRKMPSTWYVDSVAQDVSQLVSFMIQTSSGIYSGSGAVYPLLLDSSNKVILGYDSSTDSIVGAGVLDELTVKSIAGSEVLAGRGEGSQGIYSGSGAVYPLLLDSSNKVILGYDSSTDSIVGAGLGVDNGQTPVSKELPKALPTNIKPIAAPINIFMADGQSLSVGATATTILSTTQPYYNTTFSSGPRGAGNDYSSKKPLVEDNLTAPDGGTNRGETVCSGAANFAITLMAKENGVDPATHEIFAHTTGKGGTRIADLSKGTTWYNNQFLGHVNGANSLNPGAPVHAIAWIQGESEIDLSTPTAYQTYYDALLKLREDKDADIRAVNGQTVPVHMLCYQTSYKTRIATSISKAQLDICKNNDLFHHVTPCYHLPFASDSIHLTNVGYKWLGAYMGRAYKQLVIDGVFPEGIMPVSATYRGTTLSVLLRSTYPLCIDRATMAPTTNNGFKVVDSTGEVDILSMSVSSDGRTVNIHLSRTPVGAVVVRYAYDYLGTGLSISNGASGNLRDTDPEYITISGVDRPLWRPAPHFTLDAIKVGE
ncbi:sialate O-acetylesterase [Klebsiella pneumoniae]|uniref:sialate O-acetylesterase n=1 Tax=Klebsiella pneumoniae TaxID=573 RepID=UPI003B59D8B5